LDLLGAGVGLLDRGIDHLDHHRRDVKTGAVALDVRDDGVVGDVERKVRVHRDLLPSFGHFDVLVHGLVSAFGVSENYAAMDVGRSPHSKAGALSIMPIRGA
jgi:hypothetical protein